MKPTPPSYRDFASLHAHKNGGMHSAKRIAFHRKAARMILLWYIRGGKKFSTRFLAWCKCYLLRTWAQSEYLARRITRFNNSQYDLRRLLNLEGLAMSPLCLQGTVKIGDDIYTAVSRSDYIKVGTPVIVIDTEMSDLVVKRA